MSFVPPGEGSPPAVRGRFSFVACYLGVFQTFGAAPLRFLILGLAQGLVVAARVVVNADHQQLGIAGVVGLSVAVTIILILAFFAAICGAVDLGQGRPFAVAGSLRAGTRRVIPGLLTSLAAGFVVALGFFVFVIPGFMALATFAVAVPACLAEGLGPLASLRRSADLTRTHRWKVLAVILLAPATATLAAGVASGVVVAVANASQSAAAIIAAVGLSVLFWIAAAPIGWITPAVVHVRLRALAEGGQAIDAPTIR